jgi:hypothetical protein
MNQDISNKLAKDYAGRHYTYHSDTEEIWNNGDWSAALHVIAEDLEIYEVYLNSKFLDCDQFIQVLADMNAGDSISVVVRISEICEDTTSSLYEYEVPKLLENAVIKRIQ